VKKDFILQFWRNYKETKRKIKGRKSNKFTPQILPTTKDKLSFTILIFVLMTSSLIFEWLNFVEFTKFYKVQIPVVVEQQYKKEEKIIFRLRSANFTFYTSTQEHYGNLVGLTLLGEFKTSNLIFFQYIKGTFLETISMRFISREDSRFMFSEKIKNMHTNEKIGELYSALFLSTPISKELRKDLTRLGINHLVVLSGFHASLIIGFLSIISYFIYRPIHKRFFPYRNLLRDIAFFSIFPTFVYLYFLDFPPSFFRAVGMVLLGAFLFDRNMFQKPFEALFLTTILLLAFDIRLFFSIGFWFSVSGVFFILFYLQFSKFSGFLNVLLLNFWVFVAMIPPVHYLFSEFYFVQFLSPIWTIIFMAFYPLSLLAHILSFPDIFDPFLEIFLEFGDSEEVKHFQTNKYLLILYISSFILLKFQKAKNSLS
jgi:competence protein ComEC